jgi:amidohydrolase
VFPEFEVGTVGFRSGKYMAACDELSVIVRGKGGHAALPEKVINPITIAAKLILDIKKKVCNLSNGHQYVLEFGDFHAHGASNVIPDEAFLQGTLRTLDENFRKNVHELLLKESDSVSKESSAYCNLEIKRGYPTLYNNIELTNKCQNISEYFLDPKMVHELDVRMASEDFSYFSQRCPSCFFRLGVGNIKKNITHLVHTPYFDIDEKSIEIGVGLMSYLTISNLLNPRKF